MQVPKSEGTRKWALTLFFVKPVFTTSTYSTYKWILGKRSPYNKACSGFPNWTLNGVSGISHGTSDGWLTGVLYGMKTENEDILATFAACFDVHEFKK